MPSLSQFAPEAILSYVNHSFSDSNRTLQDDKAITFYLETLEAVGHVSSILALCLFETFCGHPRQIRSERMSWECVVNWFRRILSLFGLSVDVIFVLIWTSGCNWQAPAVSGQSLPTSGLGILSWIFCLAVLNRSDSIAGMLVWVSVEICTQAPRFWLSIADFIVHRASLTTSCVLYTSSMVCRTLLFVSFLVLSNPHKIQRTQNTVAGEGGNPSFTLGSRKTHENLSILSQLTFDWIAPFLAICRQRDLCQSDLGALPAYADPHVASDEFWQLWIRKRSTGKLGLSQKQNEIRIFLAVRRMWGPTLIQLCGLRLVCDVLSLSSAVIMQLLLEHASGAYGAGQHHLGYLYSLAIWSFLSIGSVMSAQHVFTTAVEEQRVFSGLSTTVFRTVIMHVPGHIAEAYRTEIVNALDDSRKVGSSLSAVIELLCLPFVALATVFLLSRLLQVNSPLFSKRRTVRNP
jgi:hypothetical protein